MKQFWHSFKRPFQLFFRPGSRLNRVGMRVIGITVLIGVILGSLAMVRFTYEYHSDPVRMTQQIHGNCCHVALFEAQLEYFTVDYIKHRLGLPPAPKYGVPPVCTSYMRTYVEPFTWCDATGCYVPLNTNP